MGISIEHSICRTITALCVTWYAMPVKMLPVCTARYPRITPTTVAMMDCCNIWCVIPKNTALQDDRLPAVAQMPQAGKDKAAECQLFADRRRHGDQQQDHTDRRVGEPREVLAKVGERIRRCKP